MAGWAAALALTLGLLSGCGKDTVMEYQTAPDGTPVVMRVNGTEIHANEYASYFLASKRSFEQQMAAMGGQGDEIWNDDILGETLKEALRSSTQSMIVQYHVLLQQFEAAGLQLDDERQEQVREAVQLTEESLGGREEFLDWLAGQGLTEQMYVNSLIVEASAQMLRDLYFGEGGQYNVEETEIEAYFLAHYLRARHILVSTRGEDDAPLTGEALAEKERLAAEIEARLAASPEAFDTLLTEYGEDPGMAREPNGYVFTEGDMVEPFYAGALALGDYEISQPVASDFGWHIIQRMPLSADYMTDAIRGVIVRQLTGYDFATLQQEWIAAAEVETVEEEIGQISFDNAFALADPQGEARRGAA